MAISFAEFEERGLEYANQISSNVVEKLKIALGVPEEDTTNEQLKNFIHERF